MNELNCSVVADLLPLYVEDIVSPETRQAIAEHLETCEECRAKYEQMLTDIDIPVEAERNKEEAIPLKRFRFHLLLNIISFPIWLPLLLAVAAVALTLYLCGWVVAICLWCVPVSFGAVSLVGIVGTFVSFAQGLVGRGLMCLACTAAGAGLAILLFFPCMLFSKWLVRCTAQLWTRLIKRRRTEK